MINLRTAMAGGGLLLSAASFIVGGLAGEQVEPVDTIGLTGGSSAPISAAEVCQRSETEVVLVTTVGGEQLYQARYDQPDGRYDLTWRPEGTIVVVEELHGVGPAEIRPQQTDDEFWQACVTNKTVRHIEEGE